MWKVNLFVYGDISCFHKSMKSGCLKSRRKGEREYLLSQSTKGVWLNTETLPGCRFLYEFMWGFMRSWIWIWCNPYLFNHWKTLLIHLNEFSCCGIPEDVEKNSWEEVSSVPLKGAQSITRGQWRISQTLLLSVSHLFAFI